MARKEIPGKRVDQNMESQKGGRKGTHDLLEAVKQAGVVGAGGAGFPTHVKLDSKVEYVIANGAECEPLLRCDRQLMVVCAEEIVRGLEIVMELTGAQEGILALKRKYGEAVAALKKAIGDKDKLRIFQLENFYPVGDEQILVYEILKRIVPEGGIPLQVGVVVDNVGTLINIARAANGIPVTTRVLTVTGAVSTPMTIEVPIGTSLDRVIELAGGATVEPGAYKCIVGGPMMGVVVDDFGTPVIKTTSGVLVLPSDHYLIQQKTKDITRNLILARAACIRCTLCTQICPRNLLGHRIEPDKIMRTLAYGGGPGKGGLSQTDVDAISGAFLCVECGACTYYGCVMGLDPCRMNHELKAQLTEKGLRNPYNESNLTPHQFRELRKIPVSRLIARLGLTPYDKDAPLISTKVEVDRVTIPLRQHLGAPSEPIVKVGDKINKGDLIGVIPKDALGANVHASISGTVREVSENIVIQGVNLK